MKFCILVFACLLAFSVARAEMAATRIVKCDDTKMVPIYIRPNYGTILNFPIKPDHVVIGGQKLFSVEYIKTDIALTALQVGARTNLFIYLLGRRCGFVLSVTGDRGDSVVRVQDAEDSKLKVKIE